MTLYCETRSEEGTQAVGTALGEHLAPNGILLLQGDLGSGKTVLARGVGSALGIDERQVQSPSFTLVREHLGVSGELIHIDLYRLEPDEIEALGLWETLSGPGVKVVEWAERLPFQVDDAVEASITVDKATEARSIAVEIGDRDRRLEDRLERISSHETRKKEKDR